MSFIVIALHLLTIYSNFSSSIPSDSNHDGTIIVKVSNIGEMKGELLIGIYATKKSFRKIKKVYKYSTKRVTSESEEVILEDIPFGTYAIAIFQDYNGNRKFDTNFMGIPKEPFGFSTNYMVKRRAPKFKEVTFEHADETTSMEIMMQKF